MATLTTNPRSPYFYFKFRLAGGKQISKRIEPPIEHSPKGASTGERKVFASRNRQKAQALANRAEELAKMASGGADESQLRDFLADVVSSATGRNIRTETTRAIYHGWLDRQLKMGKNPDTLANYRARIDRFLGWLGGRADEPADGLTLQECQSFYDLRAKAINPTTLKKELEVLGMAFATAVKKNQLRFNPWGGVDRVRQIRKKGVGSRRAFTAEQVAKLLKTADGDMSGLIYLQAYAGLRLGDASRLKWSSVDFKGAGGAGVLTFTPEKNSFEKEHYEPLHPALKAYLLQRKKGQKAAEKSVFPTLASKPIAGAGGLSRMFKKVMRTAEIDCEWQGKHGEAGKRVATLSNHSLRYFFLGTLRENLVSMESRMDIIGHTSESVHRGYSNIKMQTLAKQLGKVKALPAPLVS